MEDYIKMDNNQQRQEEQQLQQKKIDDVIDEILKGTLEGGESLCKPGNGKGYGLDKVGGHCEEGH